MAEMKYYVTFRTYESKSDARLCKGECKEDTVTVTVYNTENSTSKTAKRKFLQSLTPEVRGRTNIVHVFC